MAVFRAVYTIAGHKVGLTPEAAILVGAAWVHFSVDQYCQCRSMAWANSGSNCHYLRSDTSVKLHRFVCEATDYVRQGIVRPKRPSRHSPLKKRMCEIIAQIANERLEGSGPFVAGVNAYGLEVVFAPIINVGAVDG
jgi:hypothetical protein